MDSNSSLEKTLENALSYSGDWGSKDRIFEFYRTLLASSVHLPNMINAKIVPIFSQAVFAEHWFGKKIDTTEIPFKNLLNMLAKDSLLHLDPGQTYGKEFTAWEIERLKSGEEALEEIFHELPLDPPPELSIKSDSELFPELKAHLRAVLELYEPIDEAFLISVQDESRDHPYPFLGILHHGLSTAQRQYLIDEFKRISQISTDFQELEYTFELKDGIYRSLFLEAKPFYFAQQPLPKRASTIDYVFLIYTKISSTAQSFFNKISAIFQR
jgi:hypothetical protein